LSSDWSIPIDPKTVADRPQLPEATKAGILAMVNAASG
jgi:hypothetical protein